MSNKFIDISSYNAISNYDALVNSGLKGVIMKATEGTTYVDNIVDLNYQHLNGKISIGFYHFLRGSSEPKTQALNFWNTIKEMNFEIRCVLDVEADDLKGKAEQYSLDFIKAFREISGQDLIIYSYRNFIENEFSQQFVNDNDFWVADYSQNILSEIRDKSVVAWQYTETCNNYPFIIGDVDCNILYDDEKFFIENNLPYTEKVNNKSSILELQEELNNQCFTDKNWDELEEDGIAGELTLSACPILREGDSGNITKWVQSRLIEHDIMSYGDNDGLFGEDTRQAVIQYQENMSLDGDGIVGKKTWRKLLGV